MITIGYEFQGQPIKALTLGEVLEGLGFTKNDDGSFVIKKDDPLLNAYPRLLQDDGMGYGVQEEYITTMDREIYDSRIEGQNVKVFNLFREKPWGLKEEHQEQEEVSDEELIPKRPGITKKKHVRELGELLRQTCLNYILENGLTDVYDIEFNILDINAEHEEWDVTIGGRYRIGPTCDHLYTIGVCRDDPEYDWHWKDFYEAEP